MLLAVGLLFEIDIYGKYINGKNIIVNANRICSTVSVNQIDALSTALTELNL